MKKKWVLLSVLLVVCFAMFGFSVRAEAAGSSYSYPLKSEWTDSKYFAFDGPTGTITKYSLDGPKDVVIPAEINGVAVQHIGRNAFYELDFNSRKNLYEIQSVKFPEGLITIEAWAFAYNQLTQVELPKSLTTVKGGTFAYNRLAQVQLPEALTVIENEAFAHNQLTQVQLPKGLTTIGNKAFYENQLTQMEFPENLTIIGGYAFSNNQLTQVEFPKSLTTIERYAFYNNQLTQVKFPDGLTVIGIGAFQENELRQVEVPEKCEVDSAAFSWSVKVLRRGTLKRISKVISDPKYSWTVTFDRALDPSSVNAENFFIQDAEGSILKGIEPTLLSEKTKVRLVNRTAFEKNKDYDLVIKKDVRGQDNAKLKETVIFKFRVE